MLDADDLCGCWNEQRSFQHLDDVFFIESLLESKLDVVKCVKVADSSVHISCERMASSQQQQQQTPLLVDSGGGGGGGGSCALSSLLKSETPSPPPTQQQSQVTPPGQQQQQQQIVTQALIENNSSLNTKCGLCNDTFTAPKVLPCFHTFCQPCLEKTLESSDKLECPQCHQDCLLSSQGVAGLLSDYAISNVLESSAMEGASSLHCTACKSNESSAIARCFDCANFLCSNCVMAHQFMHCFEGHRVITLGELQNGISKDDLKMEKPVSCVRHKQEILRYFCRSCNVPICKECTLLDHPKGIHDYEYLAEVGSKQVGLIGQLIEEGKLKTSDLRNTLKSVEHTSTLLQVQYHKAQNEINETFQFYRSVLEERKLEALKELDSVYNSKQVSLSCLCQKVQDAIDKTYQTCEFMERLLKYASNTEVLVFKKLLDTKLQHILDYNPEVNLQNAYDVEFVSNYQAIQVGIRNTFGYIRSSTEQASKPQPIARPNGLVNGGVGVGGMIIGCPPPPQSCPPPNSCGVPPPSQQQQQQQQSSCNGIIERPPPSQQQQQQQPYQNGHMSSFESNILSKRFSSANNLGPFSTSLTDLNPYEKWSSGGSSADSVIYQNGGGGGGGGSSGGGSNHGGDHYHMSNADSIIELSNKLISSMNSSSSVPPPLSSSSSSSSSFPPKSQIKRQKMIYHCKFGEFGVMEGQFTEPSGVAVNAQNDIIVADTNNHRIQIFDKEGRFKFQFGECGKRDGQLLYPNRVAVVKTSGDIIVTERSPTHQIQIYNQYGQFVRKFGANILQHPRGVTVDNKGRVVVVECKVMRVIIFDQMGAVLQKFGCSKHLEFPNGVVVNDKQEIFISDNRAHCVKVFNYEGAYLRQIGGEGITNYPIGVGINQSGEILIADNHNNFNLTIFTQDGTLVNALESKVKHAQCFDVALMDDGSVVLASKDYRLYIYRYLQVPSVGL